MDEKDVVNLNRLATDIAKEVVRGLNGTLAEIKERSLDNAHILTAHETRLTMVEHERSDMSEIKSSVNDLKKTTSDMDKRLSIVEKHTEELVRLKNVIIGWIIGGAAVVVIALIALARYLPEILAHVEP